MTKFENRINRIIEEFSSIKLGFKPSEKLAKFAEELFMLIGEMNGEISFYERKLQLNTKMSRDKEWT